MGPIPQAQKEVIDYAAYANAYQSKVAIEEEKAMFYKTLQTSNALTEPQMAQLDDDLKTGKRKLIHYAVDVIFPLNGQNKIKVFDEALQKVVGIRTLTNAKLPKEVVFVPSSVQLLRGIAASASDADVLNTNFQGIDGEPVLTKAEITLGIRGNKLFKNMPTGAFDRRGSQDRVGELKLSESIVFAGDTLFEGEIEVASTANIDLLSYGKISLIGMAAMSVA